MDERDLSTQNQNCLLSTYYYSQTLFCNFCTWLKVQYIIDSAKHNIVAALPVTSTLRRIEPLHTSYLCTQGNQATGSFWAKLTKKAGQLDQVALPNPLGPFEPVECVCARVLRVCLCFCFTFRPGQKCTKAFQKLYIIIYCAYYALSRLLSFSGVVLYSQRVRNTCGFGESCDNIHRAMNIENSLRRHAHRVWIC